MEIIKMKAEERQGTGKSVAVRLRRAGTIPAVAYGKGATTLHLAVSPKELLGVLKSEHGKNSVVELGVAGKPLTVLVRDYSYHPVSRDLLHVDFIQIKLDQEVDVEVPFVTFGKCAGVTAGGQLRIVFRSLPIRCLPEKIPTKIEHDVTNVGLNEAVHASDLKLPEGVKVRFPPEQTVASVVAPEREKADEAAAAAAPAAAGAKAAPAAAAKPDAKKKLSEAPSFVAWVLLSRAPRLFHFHRRVFYGTPAMYLVVGLGNPGSKYADTRHNAGFEACDLLAQRANADAYRDKFSALTSRGRFGSEDVAFLKPQTFMNLSGQSAQPAAAFLKVPVENIVVVYDEIDLPFGEVRIKKGGGHGGHNGIRSLLERLGSPEFVRVRIGIGRPPPGFKGDVADYVLMRFDAEERPLLGDLWARAADAAEDVVRLGFLEAMNRRNGKAPAKGVGKPKTAGKPAPGGSEKAAGGAKSTPPKG